MSLTPERRCDNGQSEREVRGPDQGPRPHWNGEVWRERILPLWVGVFEGAGLRPAPSWGESREGRLAPLSQDARPVDPVGRPPDTATTRD